MLKKFRFIILGVMVIFVCTACDGDVTRSIRHDGFSIANQKFTCSAFFSEDSNTPAYNKIKYYTGAHFIDVEGRIYEVSMDQKYSSGENCRSAGQSIIVKAIMDNNIVRGADGGYYYLIGSGQVANYSKILETDNSYQIYDLLMKDTSVLKVVTADSNNGIYYGLNADGNVYGYSIKKTDRNTPATIGSTTIVFNRNEYGGPIIDFNYAGDSPATFVRTENDLYRYKAVNGEECSKYADIACQYKMQKSEEYLKYKDRIAVYNGTTLITDYRTVFKAN